jgi:hypothetical protein
MVRVVQYVAVMLYSWWTGNASEMQDGLQCYNLRACFFVLCCAVYMCMQRSLKRKTNSFLPYEKRDRPALYVVFSDAGTLLLRT